MPETATQSSHSLQNIAVSLSGVHLSYPTSEGSIEILRGIDLTLKAGEIVAVTGPSGSGKSSLMAVIAGLEKADRGTVSILGKDLADADENERTELRRNAIGVVFQSFHLIPAMTAEQNATLPLLLAGDRNYKTRAREILNRVGLGHRISHRPSALSGGEQQRVAIARAFAANPKIILADEPTGNLDQETGEEVVKMMFEMVRENHSAMLLVTHDPNLAAQCDRTISIQAGQTFVKSQEQGS